MYRLAATLLLATLVTTGTGCSSREADTMTHTDDEPGVADTGDATVTASAATRANPLLAAWDTPFGVPPFDAIASDDFLPAVRDGMNRHRAEIAAITDNPEPATFDNTVVALERSGEDLSRVTRVFYALNSAHSDETIRTTARTIAPELSAHRDAIALNSDLFSRVDAVYRQRAELALGPEQVRLLEETHKNFVRSGVGLDDDAQARLRHINGELASLSQQFGQNLLAETNAFELKVEDRADLGALPSSLVAAAAAEARQRGHDCDCWVFTLQRPSIEPFLQYSPNRELRRRIFLGYASRGNNGNDKDNNTILSEMAALRAERARLLGYPTHAHYVLSDNVAATPERVTDFMGRIWQPALAVAERERADLTAMMRADGVDGELQPWDWAYYAEKVRKQRYDLDEELLRPYFEFTAVRDGAFAVAGRLFGIRVTPRDDLPRWHSDQQVFEVSEADGTHLGILYMDFFTRESKRGGAWMNSLRPQSRLDGAVYPIVTNNFNFPPPADNEPSLLRFSEARTLFHEFGHALHGMLSDVTYSSLSGTSVPRDFVEFPSQVFENWMSEPEVLRMFARHYQTGEPIPDELIARIKAADTFNQGFATVEYMAAAYLDLAWHTLDEAQRHHAGDFEVDAMRDIALIDEIIPRYRSTYFAHIFSGGYSAGYYGYLWSEVLDADAFEAFRENGLFDAETAQRFRDEILSKGSTRPGMEMYEAFRGRAPVIDPLLERRGLAAGEG